MGLYLQKLMLELLDGSAEWFTLSPYYYEAKLNLQNTSPSDPIYDTRKTEFENIENSLLNLISK